MANIEFFLNGTPRQCQVAPDTSILTLLREHLGATGTKEGCASGDCGACTVAIADPHALTPAYTSINACITPAHQLHGKALTTVEGLELNGKLHPAQAAMIECHGSQCGFCTPGVVMSLFTLYESRTNELAPPTPEQLEAALGGNLCRCTGYRPIRDAAFHMQTLDAAPTPRRYASLPALPAQLMAAPVDDADVFYLQPDSLDALVKARARYPNARLVAGGTDLWLEATQQLTPLTQLIDITRVKALSAIEDAQFNGRKGWWVGAAVTYTELEPLLNTHFPAFAHLLHRLGSRQIRNRGTLGGNIANASPIGDTPPVLLALSAWVELTSAVKARQLPLEDFFLDYKKTVLAADEVVSRIFIPQSSEHVRCHVWKLSKRREDDISAVLGAFTYRFEDDHLHDVRIAFGGMAAIPKRAPKAEQALEGKPVTADSFRQAQSALKSDFSPMNDVRGSAEYREQAAANLIERLYLTLSTPGQEVMLHAYAH